TAATGIVPASPVGEPSPAGSAGAAGSTHSDDCGVEPGDRARSRKLPGSATPEDASGCGCVDRTGLRADYRQRGTLSVRQAGGELSGTGAAGKIQRESATAGSHHQTGEFDVAFPAGGSGPSHGAQPSGMAWSVFPFADATGTEDGKGGHGTPLGDLFVLDVASGTTLGAEKSGSDAAQPASGDEMFPKT